MAALYLETTVVSYLTARPSRDVVIAGHQQTTRDWWEQRRQEFEIHVSQLVIDEAGEGDPEAAARRLKVLDDLPLLEVGAAAKGLARTLIDRHVIARSSTADALHISIAAVHGMDYLLTWNMAHIANAELKPKIERVCRSQGFEPPVLCTPEQLMG